MSVLVLPAYTFHVRAASVFLFLFQPSELGDGVIPPAFGGLGDDTTLRT
jgi:hypothetical protein